MVAYRNIWLTEWAFTVCAEDAFVQKNGPYTVCTSLIANCCVSDKQVDIIGFEYLQIMK